MLPVWGAYTRMGLFLEFYGNLKQKRPFILKQTYNRIVITGPQAVMTSLRLYFSPSYFF